MKKDRLLLIIDPQYDFCHPQGSLYIPGAEDDMKRLSNWIIENKISLDHIIVSADAHHVNSISHPNFWRDPYGSLPVPFTEIRLEDIHSGKWIPSLYQNESVAYIQALEKQGEFIHYIWPLHCLLGSKGASLDENLFQALLEWTEKGTFYELITKGTYPVAEHFGIFRANIPMVGHPETQLNLKLIEQINQYQQIYIAGEARSHCVANSLKQLIQEIPEIIKKIIVLEDCMSDVPGLKHLGDPIYSKAISLGITFQTTTDVKF